MGHKRDWKKYNKQLVNRGKINFWVKPIFMKYKANKKKKNGYPFVYSDELVQAMIFIHFKFH